MSPLIEQLIEALKASNWSLFILIIAIALIINLRPLSDFLEDRATRHQRFIQEALEYESLNKISKSFLEEELSYYIFKRITGISADAVLRAKLQNVISRSQGELQIRQLSKVKDFIRMKDGKLQVKVTNFEIGYAYINLILGVLVALMSLTLFLAPLLGFEANISQIFISIAVSVFLFALSMFMVTQASPALTAKRLAPIVQRLEESSDEPKVTHKA